MGNEGAVVTGTVPLYRIASALESGQIFSIRRCERAVLVFGPGATAGEVTASLEVLTQQAPHTRCSSIVLSTPEDLPDFQHLIDADRLYYLACGDLPERQLAALIAGARGANGRDDSVDIFLPADDLRRMAIADNVAVVADAVERGIASVLDARRSRCVLFDREQDVLWSPGEGGEESSPAAGLVSFIVRTGMTACLPRMAGDPRVDPDLDNPDGDPSDRFLGVPVRAARGAIVAVLVALRPSHDAPFEPREVAKLEALAAHVSPYLAAWLVQTPASPFRHNALREIDQPLLAGPEPLRLEPVWRRGTPWLTVVTAAAALLALIVVLGLHHG